MLISHSKKFIFLKTSKTAGTSVESYFEKWCMPAGDWERVHYRDEYISETGIIGYRGANPGDSIFYNHISARELKRLISSQTWEEYYKFTVVRNPFDKLVSAFYFQHRDKKVDQLTRNELVRSFRGWLESGNIIYDGNKYLIDGKVVVDEFIRYESLYEGIRKICGALSVPFEREQIPTFKSGIRDKTVKLGELYDKKSIALVKKVYSFELEFFDYSFDQLLT